MHDPELGKYLGMVRIISGFYILDRYPILNAQSISVAEVAKLQGEILPAIEKLRLAIG